MKTVTVIYFDLRKIFHFSQNAIHCTQFNYSNWTAVQTSASFERFWSCFARNTNIKGRVPKKGGSMVFCIVGKSDFASANRFFGE